MTVSQSGNEIAQVSYGAADHLALLGRNAVAASDGGADSPDLIEFNRIIAAYSLNRGKPIKSESADNPGHPGVDWRRVEELGQQLAAGRCDLKLYAYLALAGFETRRDEGQPYLALAAILAATADIVEQAWERCAPKLPARRQAQLKFLSEELAITVKERPPGVAEAADFLSALSVTERLASSSGRAFGFDYPLLRELREAMKAHAPIAEAAVAAARPLPEPRLAAAPAPAPTVEPVVSQRPSEAPSSAAAPAPPTPPPPPVAAAPDPAAVPCEVPAPAAAARESIALPSLDLTGLADKSPDALEDHLAALVIALTARLRSDSITDPGPYWLLRALRWANHELLQAARTQEVIVNKYKTWLPVPQGHKNLLKSIPARLAQGQHAAVVGECEDLFATYPMWLDLQRFICQGLDGLGATAAREAVRSQIALLLARCPELPRFKFSDRDGTPLADGETRVWLQAQKGSAGAGGQVQQAISDTEPMPEGLLASVEFLQEQLNRTYAEAKRFQIQLRLVELLLTHGRNDVAWPICKGLLEMMTAYRLEEWQPELAEKALALAWRSQTHLQIEKAYRQALWHRLCRMSSRTALRTEASMLHLEEEVPNETSRAG